MCKPMAAGGRRCAAHTRPAFEAAVETIRSTTVEQDCFETHLAAVGAVAAHASTPSGMKEVTSLAVRAESDGHDDLASVLRDGERRGAAIAQAAAEAEHEVGAYVATRTQRFTARTAGSIIDRVRASGGLTVVPGTGAEPTAGFCINEVGACPKVPEDEFFDPVSGRVHIERFLSQNEAWFSRGDGKHIGFWHDKKNRTVVLDRVDVVVSFDEALALGRARKQRSMWDAAAGREIALD